MDKRFREGDRVVINPIKNSDNNELGTIEHIYNAPGEQLAIVNFPSGKRKMLLSDLVAKTDSVILTRERFHEIAEKVLDRESLEISDDTYELYTASAELIFSRMESLLFGGDNG